MMKKMLDTAVRVIVAGTVIGISHVGMAAEWQKPVYVPSDGASKGARVTYEYKDDSLFRVNTKLGFVNDIELKPGEVVTHIAGGDTKRWLIDKAVVGNVQHVYIKPIEPDIDTNIIINTNQRAYRLYVVASDDYDPLVSFTFPGETSGSRIRSSEEEPSLYGKKLNRNYEIRIKKKADKSLVPLEIFDDGQQTFIRISKENKYDLPVLYSIDPWNKKNVSMVNYRVKGEYFIADGVFPHGRLFYQQKFWIDFFNLERKATVKGTFPANDNMSRIRRNRVVVDQDTEEDQVRIEKERERAARSEEKRRLREEEKARKAAAVRAAEESKRNALEQERRKRLARQQELSRRQELERQRQIANEQRAIRERQMEEAQRQEALRQQRAQEEALRQQQLQEEAVRQQQVAEQQAAQQRQIEEQHQEALRRQQEADREAANRQYQDNEDPEDAVPVLDEKQKEQMYWDAVQRQKVYDKMYSDYERGQREGSES